MDQNEHTIHCIIISDGGQYAIITEIPIEQIYCCISIDDRTLTEILSNFICRK